MTHVPSQIHELFPEKKDAIRQLRMEHAPFAALLDAHEAVNKEIVKAEENLQPMDDLALEALKKKRLKLEDQIADMLKAHEAHEAKYGQAAR